jgi:excisionase family DNA binding protein
MSDEQSVLIDATRFEHVNQLVGKSIHKRVLDNNTPQFLSTAEAARLLGLSTTLVQTLVDQGDLTGWKTRGGHRRIAIDSIMEYQNTSRRAVGSQTKFSQKPRVTVVIDSVELIHELKHQCQSWNLPVDVHFFESVTEALLDLSSKRPDMIVVEMSMPLVQQEKTFSALVNFNLRGTAPLSVVLITQETTLSSKVTSGASSSIQIVTGPMSSIWLHAYLTGVVASCKI